ncbi:MAG: minor capsid protein [Cyanobacteria bacterium J06635_1]
MTTQDAFRLIDRYDRAVGELEADAIARVNDALDAAYRDLERELRATYPRLQSQGGLVAAQRRLLILDELGPLLQLVRPEQAQAYERMYQELIQLSSATGGEFAGQLIQAIDSEYPLRQFASVPIEAVALQAQDGVERLRRHSEDFRTRASAAVEQGLIQGWGAGRVSEILRRELGTTKGKAESIARTEVNSALNDAAQQRYKDNGVEYFQLVVTPSEGLCPYCAARNGNVYKAGEMRVPLHVRCRCVILPWSPQWQADGLVDDAFIQDYRQRNLNALKEAGQAPNNGPTYWERQAGLTGAPEPFWRPGRALPTQTGQTPSTLSRVARQALRQVEGEIVSADSEISVIVDSETGQEILRKTDGDADEVAFTPEERELLRGQILTHNHPLDAKRAQMGSGFSEGDFAFAANHDLRELRLVSGEYEYTMRPGQDGWGDLVELQEAWGRISGEEIAKVRGWRDRNLNADESNRNELLSEMNFRVWHSISRRLADEFDLNYRRSKRD